MKKLFALFFLLLLAAGSFAAYEYYQFALVPASSGKGELIVDIPPNSTFTSVRNHLVENQITINPIAFKFWVRLREANKKLRIGEFKVERQWSQLKILDELLNGPLMLRHLTVKEGHNVFDIDQEIQATGVLKNSTQFMQLIHDPELIKRMKIPQVPALNEASLEGYLFPETYSFQKYESPRHIVESMLTQFENRAIPILSKHPWGNTVEGRHRLLILASIVEKESGNPEEQPMVASVFWNRLAKKMRLQSDPTTIYGLLPSFDGNLKRIHLTTPSIYNTYTLPELPAGPISNPGESALKAVVNPAHTDNLFFVGRGDGTHVFSTNLTAHNAYVQEYQVKHTKRKSSAANEH